MITEIAHPQFKGYKEYILEDGSIIYHDRKIGKDVPAVLREVPVGSIVLTPRAQAAQREYKEKQEFLERQKVERSEQQKLLGEYMFAAADRETFSELAPDVLTRAAYLAAHLDFDSDTLWETQRTPVTRVKLHKILHLSESATDNFWRAVRDKYFFRDGDGVLHAKGQAFVMGRLSALPSKEYQKLYTSALKELYEKIPSRQHKRLGYALKMLPYLNFEYNVLCLDPTVSVYDEIIPLTVSDFCDEVGFDKTHASQLAADYGKLTFTVNGSQEVFCKFMGNGRDVTTAHIYINPRLVFKGSDLRNAAAIGVSFAADSKSP